LVCRVVLLVFILVLVLVATRRGRLFLFRAAPLRQIGDIQTVERREGDALAVGRRPRAADLRHPELLVVYRILEFHERADLLIDLRREGNLDGLAGRHGQAPDPAVVAGDEELRVRRERGLRIHVAIAGAAALAVVALHVHLQPVVFTGRQVDQLQCLARVVARGVDEPLAVRARRRAERAFELVGADEQATVVAIELRDLVRADDARRAAQRGVRIVVGAGLVFDRRRSQSRAHGAANVHPERLRVLAERRTEDRRRRRGRRAWCRWRARSAARAGHLHTGAAALVVHPELGALCRDHVLVVGRPRRRHVVLALGGGDGAGVRAVRVRHPDVLRAVAIADEDQLPAVGREGRLHVVALPAGDAGGLAAGDRQSVEIAEQ